MDGWEGGRMEGAALRQVSASFLPSTPPPFHPAFANTPKRPHSGTA